MLYLLLVTLEAPGVLRQQKHDKFKRNLYAYVINRSSCIE